MTVGLPGCGIGGLFYVVSALAMPLHEGYRRARRRGPRARWRFVAGHMGLALAIVAAMWGAGWLLGLALHAARPIDALGGGHAANLLRTATLALTVGTLVAVLGGVEVLRACVVWSARRKSSTVLVLALSAAALSGRWAAAQSAISGLAGTSRDSDGNVTFRLGTGVDLATSGTTRLSVAASHARVTDGVSVAALDEVALQGRWRPRRGSTVDASAGLVRTATTLTSSGQVRVRWRESPSGPALDFRARRGVLDATPGLLVNPVTRTELGGVVDLPVVGPLRIRGIGRATVLRDSAEANPRTTLGAALALALLPGVQVSGQYTEVRYAHASTAGYFAPRLVQLVQAGSYVEVETARALTLVLDVGAGVGRVAAQGAPLGPWRPALRGYALVALPLPGRSQLWLEAEAEDSPGAGEVATSPAWHYLSTALSLRWPLP
jgi:hypothetical protein